MKNILITIFVFISLALSAATDSPAVDSLTISSPYVSDEDLSSTLTKSNADSAYIRNDYTSAIELYELLLRDKGEAADIYYNLGNSYYKSNNIAKAIVNYERALLLKPGDKDIRFNLEMARNQTVDKDEPIQEIFFVTWFKSVVNSMSIDNWAKVAIVAFFLFILSVVLYVFSKRIVTKKIGFSLAILFFITVIVTNIFAYYQKDLLQNRVTAIVIAPSVTVKSTPHENGTELFILHEGYKVSIKDDSMKEWKEIKLEDGKVGWLPAEVIELI